MHFFSLVNFDWHQIVHNNLYYAGWYNNILWLKMENNSYFDTSELSACKHQTDWSLLCTGENLHIAEINPIIWKSTEFFFDIKIPEFTRFHLCIIYIFFFKNKAPIIVPLSKNKK